MHANLVNLLNQNCVIWSDVTDSGVAKATSKQQLLSDSNSYFAEFWLVQINTWHHPFPIKNFKSVGREQKYINLSCEIVSETLIKAQLAFQSYIFHCNIHILD